MAAMAATRALVSRANAAACPQLAKADFGSSSQHVRESQRIAVLEFRFLSDAAREHGDVRIRRKETCVRGTRGQVLTHCRRRQFSLLALRYSYSINSSAQRLAKEWLRCHGLDASVEWWARRQRCSLRCGGLGV